MVARLLGVARSLLETGWWMDASCGAVDGCCASGWALISPAALLGEHGLSLVC